MTTKPRGMVSMEDQCDIENEEATIDEEMVSSPIDGRDMFVLAHRSWVLS